MDRRVGETSRKNKNVDDDDGQRDNQKKLLKHEIAEAAESGPKRKHEGENSEQPDEKKMVATLETPEVAASTMKITDDDFIDDCLEAIIKYLALQDLINLGDTCKRFQSIIKLTFASKYKEKEICLWPEPQPSGKSIYIGWSGISFKGISRCLKVLRYFGATITNLQISFEPSLNEDQKIALADYMNEHCADTLTDITINYFTEDLARNWTKPFSKAESITLDGCKSGDLTTWFPKMRRLAYFGLYSNSVKYTFPHLEELILGIMDECQNHKENAQEVLRLNPNLQTFRIHDLCPYGICFFRQVSEYLQSVCDLTIPFCYRSKNPTGYPIHLKSVKKFKFTTLCPPHSFKIPFSFDRLEKATLNIPFHFGVDKFLVDFVKQNPSLTKLNIIFNDFDDENGDIKELKLNLAKVLPSLEFDVFDDHECDYSSNLCNRHHHYCKLGVYH